MVNVQTHDVTTSIKVHVQPIHRLACFAPRPVLELKVEAIGLRVIVKSHRR